MALIKNYLAECGIEVHDAYIRVEAVRLLGKTTVAFNVCMYVDPLKPRIEGKAMECPYDLLGPNPIGQAYAYLKTMPQFSDAVDA